MRYISFEGVDGCGKTTFLKKFIETCNGLSIQVVKLSPPEGITIEQQIQNSIFNEEVMSERIQGYLLSSVTNLLVIQDRGPLTTCAYNLSLISEGMGELRTKIIDHYERIKKPDITFFVDTPLNVCVQRVKKRDGVMEEGYDKKITVLKKNFEEIISLKRQCVIRVEEVLL